MPRSWLVVICATALLSCTKTVEPPPPPEEGLEDAGRPIVDADAGFVDAGTDAGTDTGTPNDAGTPPDAGNPAAGPWPDVPLKDYSADYRLPAVQSVGVDEGYNLWLLAGDGVGVLRPGDSEPTWTYRLGQAAYGFGTGQLATGSTVICGGSAGRAYVGYSTTELPDSFLGDVTNPEYQKGDVDVVQLNPDGTVSLETHLQQSVVYLGGAQNRLGIRNTNDWRYDEDRSVLVCNRIMIGANKGDVFIGTNHGVTMIRGTVYNSHRHPVWDVGGSLRIGYSYALGFSFDQSQVLIGNEWKYAVLPAPVALDDWDSHEKNPWILDTFVPELNSLEEMDFWRGITQTKDGSYYLASESFGLWKLVFAKNGWPTYSRVPGLPSSSLGWLQGTADGSLFIATQGAGLWRMTPEGALARVPGVPGSTVRQLVYDPSVTPPMLFVLTNAGLTVLRGF